MALIAFLFSIILLETVYAYKDLKVSLVNDGPAVRGSNVTFTATVTGYDGSEKLEFVYWDNAQPQHYADFYVTSNISIWVVEYPRDLYESGQYTVNVDLKRKSIIGIYYVVGSANSTFKLTDSLNGNLVLTQNYTERPNDFVAVNKTVHHSVVLPDNELKFLNENASTIITYWFMNCDFVGMTTDLSFNFTYEDVMASHYIDVLVVADHKPLPPLPAITTTTTAPTPTIMTPTTNTTTTTITTPILVPVSNVSSTTTESSNINANESQPVHKLTKRSFFNKTVLKKKSKSAALKNFICNNTIVPIGDSYTYGHYQKTINVREPIGPVNITGLNWLQHGDLMNLLVKYTGSPPFDYCAIYKMGQYNITGNETCTVKSRTTSNGFPLVHYFSDSDQHTVVVIIENEIGKVATRATINIYKVSVHAQLSVIVVPVVFCLLAVILVVFGIAYYQHRSRYTVEVADFDFGQQSNFDYKTFTERLRDSFRNAFKFGHHDDTDPLTANTRYDSMT